MQPKRVSAIKESFKDYPYQYQPKHPKHLDRKVYRKVLTRVLAKIAEELISKGTEINLPSRIGSLQVIKYKTKNKSVDYHLTKKLYGEYNKDKAPEDRKKVYHKNRHTDGYKVRLYWRKKDRANFKNKSKWSLKFTRPNIRPNSYNKNNPKVSLVPYIMKHGVDHYHEY
jgi:hypothetical protein